MAESVSSNLRALLHLIAYPGSFEGRPSEEQIREMAKTELARLPDETTDEDKADLLSMAAVVARAGRETNGVKAELMQRASRVLVAVAESRQTRRHRGCGPDCSLPAGHLGDHSPEEPAAPLDSDAEVFTRAVVAGVGRWEFFTGSDEHGEVCVGGLRYATRLEVGVPKLGPSLRAALERHTVWKLHPSPRNGTAEDSK